MKENKQIILITLLVINAVLILYFGVTVNRSMKSNQVMLVNQINNVNSSLAYLDSTITQRIESVLDAQDNMIAASEYTYVNIDAANNKALVDLSVQLKAVDAGSRIYAAFSETDSNAVHEIELTKKEGLSYDAAVELKLDKNYQYDVIERKSGGGEVLLNTNQEHIRLYDRFYRMRVMMDSSGASSNNDQISFDFTFSADDFGIGEFGLDRVLIELYYAGRMIDQIDATDKIAGSSHSNLKERYNIAVASGQIDSDLIIEEFSRQVGYDSEDRNSTRTYYTLIHNIIYATDYPELELDSEKAGNLYANLIITCKDGYLSEW